MMVAPRIKSVKLVFFELFLYHSGAMMVNPICWSAAIELPRTGVLQRGYHDLKNDIHFLNFMILKHSLAVMQPRPLTFFGHQELCE
jgi:hypothetical protein